MYVTRLSPLGKVLKKITRKAPIVDCPIGCCGDEVYCLCTLHCADWPAGIVSPRRDGYGYLHPVLYALRYAWWLLSGRLSWRRYV
ncbi:MAG: hypothetical protein JW839_02195 [Candidatus Lokiarchaeota archaeon]|nr:hypothetical protein [Candidatus Lokiarchaeota archaeon]